MVFASPRAVRDTSINPPSTPAASSSPTTKSFLFKMGLPASHVPRFSVCSKRQTSKSNVRFCVLPDRRCKPRSSQVMVFARPRAVRGGSICSSSILTELLPSQTPNFHSSKTMLEWVDVFCLSLSSKRGFQKPMSTCACCPAKL
jgi:hypothetical protein